MNFLNNFYKTIDIVLDLVLNFGKNFYSLFDSHALYC
jgi:hypothetical protein